MVDTDSIRRKTTRLTGFLVEGARALAFYQQQASPAKGDRPERLKGSDTMAKQTYQAEWNEVVLKYICKLCRKSSRSRPGLLQTKCRP